MRRWTFTLGVLVWIVGGPVTAQRYSAQRVGDVVRLHDAGSQTRVSILPALGNVAFEMSVKGHQVLWWPYSSVEDFKTRPVLSGIPLLAPWANRLDEPAFYANGKRYSFDMDLGNVRGPIPIHGFLQRADEWRVLETNADMRAAWVTSRLEFFRQPAWMKQWPFAHTIEITHRLEDGILEVRTTISNESADPMPIAIGFHPYFQLTDSPRNDWTIAVGARTQWLLASNKVPTGETRPIRDLFPDPQAARLKDYALDDVFADLVRDAGGRAVMSMTGKSQRLDVVVGPNYRAVVIYSPADRNFVCFEPMAAVTNALNLAHKGMYKDLQSVAPGGTWRESFWVQPKGF